MYGKRFWLGPKVTTFSIAFLGVLIALRLIVSRFASITLTKTLHISLVFIITVIIAYFYGPLWTAGINGIMNVVTFFIYPSGSPFFWGYTLSPIIAGLIYGIFLYPRHSGIVRVIISVSLVSLIVNVFLNTLWGSMLYHLPFWVTFDGRIVKELVQLVPQIIICYVVLKAMDRLKIESRFG